MAELIPVADRLWVCEQPLKFMGAEVGARMSVVKLSSGGLLLYSPVRVSDELKREVDALGPVEQVVAPNKFHHLFVKQWTDAYPKASAFIAHGLHKKRPDLTFCSLIEDGAAPWSADLDHVPLRGQPVLNEVVFFHKSSRTLICADAVHNVGREKPWTSRVFYSLVGGYGGFKTNLLDRLAARDKPALRESMRRVLCWDIDRVIMAHGVILDHGGRESLRTAYRWLGDL